MRIAPSIRYNVSSLVVLVVRCLLVEAVFLNGMFQSNMDAEDGCTASSSSTSRPQFDPTRAVVVSSLLFRRIFFDLFNYEQVDRLVGFVKP